MCLRNQGGDSEQSNGEEKKPAFKASLHGFHVERGCFRIKSLTCSLLRLLTHSGDSPRPRVAFPERPADAVSLSDHLRVFPSDYGIELYRTKVSQAYRETKFLEYSV